MKLEYIPAKTLISNYNKNNWWFGINYNMNIYKGCSHGCIYCDSRSECYGVENFDKVRAKKDAIQIITNELRKKRKKGVIGTGAMSDPYNPFEKEMMITREALKEINNFNFGIAIATKSDLVLRDIDILKKIKSHSPTLIKITITTFDDELCKRIEPNVCVTSKRFKAIKGLSNNGIFTGILLMPILPFINDNEENIVQIVRKAHECGAKFIFAYGMGLTLRGNQREYFYNSLMEKFPNKNIVAKYKETFGNKYECASLNHKRLWYIFKNECEKLGILYKMEDIILAYKSNYGNNQISWF
ncbi:radical SAM protein [Clostridium sporogenes]|uniref:Radical SAM protein n=1 Tax=Clostridium botulinum TaxID=1491 RepID=A0A6M0SWP1_CLOBO|nr:radical SAM protein [Clostridium sporogenes]NFA59917.1 radical SAM protein [Clostridium botulinum]NFI74010.1 radical SAM protein [Clostridium sporogenes]NFL71724.1 radical SAM protein [Clostridium sporogenes]NFM24580.1 radical SAM protein [Clostridium sporogenes]NFP61884.1 radical SAM protein [Clostridium sporogenes]